MRVQAPRAPANVFRIIPNRPLSLLGLARSYAALGQEEAAKKQYQKLAEVWKDRDFPVVEEANRYLAVADDAD